MQAPLLTPQGCIPHISLMQHHTVITLINTSFCTAFLLVGQLTQVAANSQTVSQANLLFMCVTCPTENNTEICYI